MRRRGLAFGTAGVLAVALAVAWANVAHATPGSGVLSSMVWARGVFTTPVDIKIKVEDGSQKVLHVPNTAQNLIQQIVLSPGGHTGWHSHPGPAMALITSGELTLFDGDDRACTGRTYRAGEAFVDPGQGHVHMARNLSSSNNVEVWVTYLDVPITPAGQPPASPRIDEANPGNCPF